MRLLKEKQNISIHYRWDRIEQAYEIWVEDETQPYPEIYHQWVGDKKSLQYELNELEQKYNVKAKRYKSVAI